MTTTLAGRTIWRRSNVMASLTGCSGLALMAGRFRLACIQVNAGNEIAPNIEAASALIQSAVKDGAQVLSARMRRVTGT